MERKDLLQLIHDKLSVTVFPEQELVPIEGNVMTSGDDKYDKEVEEKIKAKLESGNEWAWCCACVEADFSGIKETSFLDGCSYNNKEEFMNGDYFNNMKCECVENIAQKIEAIFHTLNIKLESIPKPKETVKT